jgi:hypothetical protein
MITEKNLKRFSKKFDDKLIEEYTKFILTECKDFQDYVNIVDEFPRSSKEFKNLTLFHLASLEDEKYNELYQITVKKLQG